MSFYKSKNTTISERLTGISNENGFGAARKLVNSELWGPNQKKEVDSWCQDNEEIKRNWWEVVSGIVAVASGITTVWAFFF